MGGEAGECGVDNITLLEKLFHYLMAGAGILTDDTVANLKEMTDLDPILAEGDVLVSQETADVVDEGDIVTDEKDVPDVSHRHRH